MDRLACVNVAALPLQLLLRAHPDWRTLPVAVIDADKPQGLVLYVNAPAREQGVRSGQRYATALSIARELRAGTAPRTQITREVVAITDRLRRFTPHVEPSADRPGIFWLDAQGLGRLYPSLETWAEGMRGDLHGVGLASTVAVAFSRFGSFALAIVMNAVMNAGTKVPAYVPHYVPHSGDGRGTDGRGAGLQSRHVLICADPADEHARVQRVPLASIGLDPDVRDRLLALGITTVGEFLCLPAGGIRARFGVETDALYQLAAGTRFSPLVPAPLEEPNACAADFDCPETNVDRLIFVVKRLLDGLAAAIARQVRTIVSVVMRMTLDNRDSKTEQVRPAAPTLDVPQLLTLIRLRLEAIQLPAGIVTLMLTAETCPAGTDQRRLFPAHSRRETEAATQALARLRAECGEHSVVRARLCDAHLPGSRFTWEPLDAVPPRSSPRVVPVRPLVRRIFERPVQWGRASFQKCNEARPLYVLSGGWWGPHAVHREYSFVRTESGETCWIYYDRRRQRIFLQGHVE